jgi:hypothetical protein
MKFQFTVLIIFSGIHLYSQNFIIDNFPTKDGLILYTDVIELDSNVSASDLYLNAKKWIVETSRSSSAVIQLDDKEANIIIIKSYIDKGSYNFLNSSSNYKFWFTLTIETKDGRYRYTLNNVIYEAHVRVEYINHDVNEPFEIWMSKLVQPKSERKKEEFFEQHTKTCQTLDQDFKNIILSLEKFMVANNKSDW